MNTFQSMTKLHLIEPLRFAPAPVSLRFAPVIRKWLGIAILLVAVFNSSVAYGSDLPRDHDEFWMISARDIEECQVDVGCEQLKCYRKINGQWCPASFSELTSLHHTDPSKQTVLHVHGTRTNFDDARRQCSTVYQNIFANCNDRPAVRFVCWSWRSESESHRPVREYKTKSRRAVMLGRIFTKTLRCFGQRAPVLIGYSLGTQLIASAITDPSAADLPCYRFAALAPVLDCDFPKAIRNPGKTQQMVMFTSSADRATRFARRICKKQCVPSFEQWATSPSQPLGPVKVVDVTKHVGAKHAIDRYTRATPVVACINRMVADNAMQLASQMVNPQLTSPQISAEPTWMEPELQEPTLIVPAE